MKVKEISCSKTVSVVANFQKIEVRFSATAELGPKDDATDESAELQEFVDNQVLAAVERGEITTRAPRPASSRAVISHTIVRIAGGNTVS